MNQVTIEFATQLRTAGLPRSISMGIEGSRSVASLLGNLRRSYPEGLTKWISEQGEPVAGLLVFVNDAAAKGNEQLLRPGDRVMLMSLVSGG